jgi:hypothetical protein
MLSRACVAVDSRVGKRATLGAACLLRPDLDFDCFLDEMITWGVWPHGQPDPNASL